MNIKIDISLCRVCLKQGPGTNIHTGNILEKFIFTTLVQVSTRKILLLQIVNSYLYSFICCLPSYLKRFRCISNSFLI